MATKNQGNGKVAVFGCTEITGGISTVQIYRDGKHIEDVPFHGKKEIEIDQRCELTLKAPMHTETCMVSPGDWVQLAQMGAFIKKLKAYITNEKDYEFTLRQIKAEKRKDAVQAFSGILLLFLVLMLIAYLTI